MPSPENAAVDVTDKTQTTVFFVGCMGVDDIAIPHENLHHGVSNPVNWERRAGGVAANVARVVSQQLLTEFVGAIGADEAGQQIKLCLEREGITTHCVIFDTFYTGRYTAVLNESAELYVGLSDTGITESLTWHDILPLIPKKNIGAIVLDANLSHNCLNDTFQGLDNKLAIGVKRVALAVSPAKVTRLKSVAPYLDLLICNRAEAAALSALPAETNIGVLADTLQQMQYRRFIITDGAQHSLVQDGHERHSVSAPQVNFIKTVNGAGDAFAGGTITAWLHGESLKNAAAGLGTLSASNVLSGKQQAPLLTL